MSEDLFRQVQERAYEIWECEGRPEGRELEHWLLAEDEVTKDRQISEVEITEEREHLREMDDATHQQISNADSPVHQKKKVASVRP